MTYQLDVAIGRDVVARWCALAEQRLEYLTELFETGRWRRFHSEGAFLENIQEAKTAVETWRDLSLREASRNIQGIDMSWLGRARRRGIWRDPVHLPKVAEIAVAKPPAPAVIAELDSSPADKPSGARLSDDNPTELMQKLMTVVERYPLLRNRL